MRLSQVRNEYSTVRPRIFKIDLLRLYEKDFECNCFALTSALPRCARLKSKKRQNLFFDIYNQNIFYIIRVNLFLSFFVAQLSIYFYFSTITIKIYVMLYYALSLILASFLDHNQCKKFLISRLNTELHWPAPHRATLN